MYNCFPYLAKGCSFSKYANPENVSFCSLLVRVSQFHSKHSDVLHRFTLTDNNKLSVNANPVMLPLTSHYELCRCFQAVLQSPPSPSLSCSLSLSLVQPPREWFRSSQTHPLQWAELMESSHNWLASPCPQQLSPPSCVQSEHYWPLFVKVNFLDNYHKFLLCQVSTENVNIKTWHSLKIDSSSHILHLIWSTMIYLTVNH